MSRLREDYRKQWGKVLSIMPLAFGNLLELMQWEAFHDVIKVVDADHRGERG